MKLASRRAFRRVARVACCLVAALVASSSLGLAGEARAATAVDADEVWITLGADAFASATKVFLERGGGETLTRFAAVEGVVLTRVSRAGLATLGEQIHRDLRRCGGFIVHDSFEEARAELARVASASRTVAVLPFRIDEPLWVSQVAGSIAEAQILATMTTLSTSFANRYHAHPAGAASASWIRDLWAGYAAGRPEVTVELFSHGAITPQPSVVLTIPGTTLADEVVILGGHQDSILSGSGCSGNPNCSAPGADDDASGIATLSEVARVALASGFQPQRTIQLIAYAAEEVGLRGSTDIATNYLAAGANVVAVLQQDMTGYNGSVADVALISDYTNAELTAFLADLLETYQPGVAWTTTACGYACSDHAPWHNRGYPAAFAFEARFGEYNPWIHSTGDTVAHLGNSAAHAAKFARLAAAFLVEAGLDEPPSLFADGFDTGTTAAWSQTVP